jgi:hypothetical protein
VKTNQGWVSRWRGEGDGSQEEGEIALEGEENGQLGDDKGGKKLPAKRRFQPIIAARKSLRNYKPLQENEGMYATSVNKFAILNSCEDEMLESISSDCDVCLGSNKVEVREAISAIKLEELASAEIAEVSYKHKAQENLVDVHLLEGENLDLGIITNRDRGVLASQEGVKKGRGEKTKCRLSRELKRIS